MGHDDKLALCARLGLALPPPGKKLRPAAVAKALRAIPSDGLRIHLKRELQSENLINKPTN
jgi:hypothetical protein